MAAVGRVGSHHRLLRTDRAWRTIAVLSMIFSSDRRPSAERRLLCSMARMCAAWKLLPRTWRHRTNSNSIRRLSRARSGSSSHRPASDEHVVGRKHPADLVCFIVRCGGVVGGLAPSAALPLMQWSLPGSQSPAATTASKPSSRPFAIRIRSRHCLELSVRAAAQWAFTMATRRLSCGTTVGDIGPKLGMATADNGIVAFICSSSSRSVAD
jgi:hypothetical protein